MLAYLVAASIAFLTVTGAVLIRNAIVEAAGARRLRDAHAGEGQLGAPHTKRTLKPRDHERLDLEQFDVFSIERAATAAASPLQAGVKRSLDITLSLGLLIFLAPLLAVTAIAIRLDSKGPIVYRQKRVGRGGVVFEVLKFRSMVQDAEADGPQYAAVGDQRITRVGYFIRRLRIDEIPQTINVLRGEMSFVGPRPERPEFVSELENEIPHYRNRHLVKPGITGWAQVKYEYAASVAGAREKLRYDLFYIARYTPLMDLAIVLLTVRVALFGLGSR